MLEKKLTWLDLTSREHVVDVSCDFVGGVPSSYVTTLLSLGSIDLMELQIMAFVIWVQIPIPIPIPMLRFQCRCLQMAVLNSIW